MLAPKKDTCCFHQCDAFEQFADAIYRASPNPTLIESSRRQLGEIRDLMKGLILSLIRNEYKLTAELLLAEHSTLLSRAAPAVTRTPREGWVARASEGAPPGCS